MEKNTVFGWLDDKGKGLALYGYICSLQLEADKHNGLMDAINEYITAVLKEV